MIWERLRLSDFMRFRLLPFMVGNRGRLGMLSVAPAAAGLLAVLFAWVKISAKEAQIVSVEKAPQTMVGLVLGCSPALRNGNANLFFQNRIARAAELFHSGKVVFLLVSGDNSRTDYDEPTAMRDALVSRGVPPNRIIRDFAGFSTLDSVVRAKKVFGLSAFVVVSQKDHAMRAIYLAEAHGISAIGVAAEDVRLRYAYRTKARETFARVRAVLDVAVLDRKPRFLQTPWDDSGIKPNIRCKEKAL
jgi:SanA protein